MGFTFRIVMYYETVYSVNNKIKWYQGIYLTESFKIIRKETWLEFHKAMFMQGSSSSNASDSYSGDAQFESQQNISNPDTRFVVFLSLSKSVSGQYL
jgi:hypothetical protein